MPIVLVAGTKDEAERKIGEAIRAYGKNEDVNPILVLKLAEQHEIDEGPIKEALELAYKAREALARQQTHPEETSQSDGVGARRLSQQRLRGSRGVSRSCGCVGWTKCRRCLGPRRWRSRRGRR